MNAHGVKQISTGMVFRIYAFTLSYTSKNNLLHHSHRLMLDAQGHIAIADFGTARYKSNKGTNHKETDADWKAFSAVVASISLTESLLLTLEPSGHYILTITIKDIAIKDITLTNV